MVHALTDLYTSDCRMCMWLMTSGIHRFPIPEVTNQSKSLLPSFAYIIKSDFAFGLRDNGLVLGLGSHTEKVKSQLRRFYGSETILEQSKIRILHFVAVPCIPSCHGNSDPLPTSLPAMSSRGHVW